MAQNTMLMIAALIAVFGIGLFLLSRRMKLRGSLLAILLVFVAAMFMGVAQPVSAQSSECTGDDEVAATTLQLRDDSETASPGDDFLMSIADNDLFKDGDPIDWDTLDLNPETDEVDWYFSLMHPDDASYQCGGVEYLPDDNLEAVRVTLNPECYGDDTIDFPDTLTFQYTASSQSGKKAPQPATVTIIIEFDNVTAFDHEIFIGGGVDPEVNVAEDATTLNGTIDPDSVDLDPETAGRQTSITVPSSLGPDLEVTLTVNSAGLVTAEITSGSIPEEINDYPACNQDHTLVVVPYTIENTLDEVSDPADITVTFDANCPV